MRFTPGGGEHLDRAPLLQPMHLEPLPPLGGLTFFGVPVGTHPVVELYQKRAPTVMHLVRDLWETAVIYFDVRDTLAERTVLDEIHVSLEELRKNHGDIAEYTHAENIEQLLETYGAKGRILPGLTGRPTHTVTYGHDGTRRARLRDCYTEGVS